MSQRIFELGPFSTESLPQTNRRVGLLVWIGQGAVGAVFASLVNQPVDDGNQFHEQVQRILDFRSIEHRSFASQGWLIRNTGPALAVIGIWEAWETSPILDVDGQLFRAYNESDPTDEELTWYRAICEGNGHAEKLLR